MSTVTGLKYKSPKEQVLDYSAPSLWGFPAWPPYIESPAGSQGAGWAGSATTFPCPDLLMHKKASAGATFYALRVAIPRFAAIVRSVDLLR